MSDDDYLQLPYGAGVYKASVADAADQFVSNIFGVSNTDERGIARNIGCWVGGLERAVFWLVSIVVYENVDYEVRSNYEVTCIYVSSSDPIYRYLIIRPEGDLSLCRNVEPPVITFIDKGETVIDIGSTGRRYYIDGKLMYNASIWSWGPSTEHMM